MICVTVTPASRRLAKADLLNAARQGDIVELCLDKLVKTPDVKDLIAMMDKPIIVSCRRSIEGGHWQGSEEERLTLLRQSIVAGPQFIELDLDIAPHVPRFGEVQRVISFTRLDRPETDIDDIFDEAARAHADVVKFTWPTPTIDDAWPLLAAVSQKRRLPIVGMGLGRAELTFSLLGRKYGSPWIYAALERGMEAHDGQATVFELDEIYRWRDIDRKTVFIAVAGFGESQTTVTRVFNTGFQQIGMNVRCLPIEIGRLNRLPKMLDLLNVKVVVVRGQTGVDILPMAEHIEKPDRPSRYVDLLLKKSNGWHGYNSIGRVGVAALESVLGQRDSGERPFDRLNVMVLGTGGVAQTMVSAISRRKGRVSICGPDDKQAHRCAGLLDCRHIPWQNIYGPLVDVVVIADPTIRCGQGKGKVNPSLLKGSQTVLDVSDPPQEHELFLEARDRNCKLVEPAKVFRDQIAAQFQAITKQELPLEAVQSGLAGE